VKDKPNVSILLANWNSKEYTLNWLSAVSSWNYPKENVEIIIHDTASNDGSPLAIKEKMEQMRPSGWKNIELIESEIHPGICRAYNQAFEMVSTKAKYILIIHNDVFFDDDGLDSLVAGLENKSEANLSGCRIVYFDEPSMLQRGAVFRNWWGWKNENVDSREICECDDILDCVFLLKRDFIGKEQSLLNEDLYFFYLGSDLCQRITLAGKKIIYNPHVTAYHKTALFNCSHL